MDDKRRLRLFVIPGQETSRRAVENARHLGDVEVVDLLLNPDEAERYGVLAVPLLVAEAAGQTLLRVVGDLSDLSAVRARLDLTS